MPPKRFATQHGQAERPKVDVLIDRCVARRRYADAFALARYGASQEMIERLIERCIKKGWAPSALELAALRVAPGLTPLEVDRLIESCVKQGWPWDAIEQGLARRGSQAKVDLLIDFCIERVSMSHTVELAKCGASQEKIERLVRWYIDKGSVSDVVELIGLRTTAALTDDELDRLLSKLSQK